MEKIRAKKSLGQHFLTSEKVLRRILDAAEPLPASLVVEIGPGTGVLTRGLLERGARVVAVEKDETLAARLAHDFSHKELTIVPGDILEVDLNECVEMKPYQVVANIPYYLSGRLFRYFFEEAPRPERLTLLIQKEVAERLLNRPGEGNLLGLAARLHSNPELLFTVPASAFRPAPKVESAVVRLRLHPEPHPRASEILRLARYAFAGRRKQLRGTLAAGLQISPSRAAKRLERAGIDPTRRPQELSLPEWERLQEAFR
jgi:16S rRNA (adenine1518-N6/adenine1519-N6)-dimethyltransferase